MLEQSVMPLVHQVVLVIELVGVGIIAVGALITFGNFLHAILRRKATEDAIACFRTSLGRTILMGLEFLVAADIINTVVIELTLENVISLAVIVFIRTLLSFSLEAEIEGRWPWQRGEEKNRSG